jgi:hypothetical protein
MEIGRGESLEMKAVMGWIDEVLIEFKVKPWPIAFGVGSRLKPTVAMECTEG